MEELKQCKGKVSCGEWKLLSEFELRSDTGNYRSNCKDCRKIYMGEYYITNKPHIMEINAIYNETHKEEQDAYHAKYRKDNKETISSYNKKYSEEHRDEINKKQNAKHNLNKEQINTQRREKYNNDPVLRKKNQEHNKKYRIENQDKIKLQKHQSYEIDKANILEKARKYREQNPEKVRKSKNNAHNKRYNNDPIFKFQRIVSKDARNAIKQAGGDKAGKSTKHYLPQSAEETWKIIELLFSLPSNLTPDGTVWMTRDNWKKYDPKTFNPNDPSTWTWNLDHIKPHSNFHYEDMECQAFNECWDNTNLRPLRSDINNKDSDNRVPEQIVQIKQEIKEFLESQKQNKKAA